MYISLFHVHVNFLLTCTVHVCRYDERIDRVETRIAARLRDQLGTAKSANEMFRIFSRYNALFVRSHIRGAIREYQTQLIQRVKDDIESLHNKFKVRVLAGIGERGRKGEGEGGGLGGERGRGREGDREREEEEEQGNAFKLILLCLSLSRCSTARPPLIRCVPS